MAQITSKEPGRVIANNEDVTVPGTGNTKLLEITVDDIDHLGISVEVSTKALDAFVFEGRVSPDAAYATLKSATWSTVSGLLLATSGDVAAQAAGTTGLVVLDVRGLYSVKISVSAASDSASVNARAIGK